MSTSTSTSNPPPLTPQFSPAEITTLNAQLAGKSPQDILRWAIDNVEGLFQTTAFGLTGMAALDMISKICQERNEIHLVPLIFLDTLYHFPETLTLSQTASETYLAPLHIYHPPPSPLPHPLRLRIQIRQRAYRELGVRAVITGRRKSQGADRGGLGVLEVGGDGVLKVNPLIEWSFSEVKEYIDKEGVPYNPLLDRGYKSIGDTHSTAPPDPTLAAGDAGERAGRWKGKAKTECGLHRDPEEMRRRFEARQRAAEVGEKGEGEKVEA